jgi:hypothetical protein
MDEGAGDVPTGPAQACYQSGAFEFAGIHDNDRYGAGGLAGDGGKARGARQDYIGARPNQLGCHGGKLVRIAGCVTNLE